MKTSSLVPVSLRMRLFAWLNIAVQAALPLAVAFTPAVAGAAGSDGRFLHEQAVSAMQTRVYTLGEGESVSSVARKYNMSVDSLRKLNQFRTFAHGFDHLQAGDELDVPVAPLPEVRWDDTPSGAVSDKKETEDDAQTKVAGYASQAGNFLSASTRSDAAASMARGMASGAASGEIQQWLSRFGTARVQLDADKNFSLKNSQLDLLVPLYEQKDRLVFTQGSIHRTDDRTQANLGAGVRRFYDAWMFGANSFLDYDLSRDHARAGAGLEYWRDFLKLGFNGYIPLTGWKDSPDLTDYQERPARGWDVRAQYWLPALPQLGGKLTYEQYYGKEVALFGIDSRQRDPHAITAGINYTPVPLLTFSAEQRQGAGSNAETRFGVDMNYQLGMPWQHQINPDAVAAMRSLAGSRYDLVERNNNIVLEYRKKEVIRLKTADLVTGHTGEQKSLGVSVNSKYGLERIDWSASSLIAAGGKIVQSGEDWAVVMPAYRADVNSYTVQGVAVDRKGNRSNQAETQVTVQAPQVSAVQSTFTPATSSLAADGRSVQALTLSLRDGNNQAVDMDVKDISLKNSALKSAAVSALTRKSAGVYTVTVTAGTDPETVTLTPSVSGITLSPAEVTISSITPDEGRSAIKTDATTYVSGSDMTVTVTLKDASDNAVTGAASSLTTDTVIVQNATLKSGSSWKDNSDGTYTATYTATTAGTGLKATMTLSGWNTAAQSGTYAITAGDAVQANSTITRDSDSYTSGSDITVTVTLKDGSTTPAPVSGLSSDTLAGMVTVANAEAKSGTAWTETAAGSGVYTGVYVARTVGTGLAATLTVRDGSKTSATYAITAGDAVQANSTITRDSDSYTSGSDITVTVTLKDGSTTPAPVSGLSSDTLAGMVSVANAEAKSGTAWTETAAGSGVYTGVYVARTVGTGLAATLTVRDGSKTSDKYSIAVIELKDVTVNGYTFAKDAGFPTSGFTGATFTLNLTVGTASDYTWKSDADWVSVADGVVKFTGTGTGSKVTITGTPKSDKVESIKYSFTLNGWFIGNGETKMAWSEASRYCSLKPGYSLPTVAQMALHSEYTAIADRGIGALWNEWGDLSQYSDTGMSGGSAYSSELKSSGSHYYIILTNGVVYNAYDSVTRNVVCRQGF